MGRQVSPEFTGKSRVCCVRWAGCISFKAQELRVFLSKPRFGLDIVPLHLHHTVYPSIITPEALSRLSALPNNVYKILE